MHTSKTRFKNISAYPRRAALISACGFIFLLFFKNSEAAAEFVSRGVEICISRLIPSLFPFLVLSSLLVYSGADEVLGRTLGKPLALMLGISSSGACAVILGFLCGFPVGAKCAYGLLGEGKIEKAECQRLLTVCSIPSPAFVVGVLGIDVLGSQKSGWMLWGICVACALGFGIVMRFISPLQKYANDKSTRYTEMQKFSAIFTAAVRDGAKNMLYVCAFVIFFSSFLGTLDAVLSPLALGDTQNAILFGFFELASGAERIAELAPRLRFALCALVAGWSGLSVHFQTMAICSGSDIKFSPYIISHALRAGVGFLVAVVLGCIL